LVVDRVLIFDQRLPFVLEASTLVKAPHELEQLVDLARRARHIFPESESKVEGLARDFAPKRLALRFKVVP
jgi:hypothetical protein